jgi:hypothetical protein
MPEDNTPQNQPLTDEQLTAAFPGQDIAHLRSMMGKMDGTSEDSNEGTNEGTSEGEGGTDEDTVEYPDWIPEKFRQGSVEEAMQKLAQSYGELERNRQGNKDGTDDSAGDGEVEEITMEDVIREYTEDGKLSDETYAALKEAGYDRGIVDGYVAGQVALGQQLATRVQAAAGGEEAYTAMLQWAKANWSDSQIEAFDRGVYSGDEGQTMMVVNALKAAYTAANGNSPKLLSGDGTGSATSGYASRAEMTAAMRDPRYKKDPAYRKQVEAKVGASTFW